MPNFTYNENTDTIEIENTGISQAKIDRAYHVIELALDNKLLLDIENLHTLNQVYVKGSSAYTTMSRRIINTRSRLRRALDLLTDIGDIVSYTLRADGRLNINWFDPNTVPDITPISDIFSQDDIRIMSSETCMPKHTGIRHWFNYFPNISVQHKHEYYRDKREAWYIFKGRTDNTLLNYVYCYGKVSHSPKQAIKVVNSKTWLDTIDVEPLHSRPSNKPDSLDIKAIAESF